MTIILRPMHFANKKVSLMLVAPQRENTAWTMQHEHRAEVQCYAIPDFKQVNLDF
jgi:hypothetical protein